MRRPFKKGAFTVLFLEKKKKKKALALMFRLLVTPLDIWVFASTEYV